MNNAIEIKSLTKTYNTTEVIKNFNFNVTEGKIYALLGQNGAGKTTIMKLLLNLITPTTGNIKIFNKDFNRKNNEILKNIGSLIEIPVFYESLTARENLELHCDYMNYKNKQDIDKVLDLINLPVNNNKKVKEFSLGMKQKLAIARAILTKPKLLILDEPTNALDPQSIKDVRNLLLSLAKNQGTTILISSHILSEIEQLADNIAIISNGELINEITSDELTTLKNKGYSLEDYFIELSKGDSLHA